MDELERTMLTRVKFKWAHRFFFNSYNISEINKWCERNCRGAFRITQEHQYIQFEDDQDAVLYSLKWLSR